MHQNATSVFATIYIEPHWCYVSGFKAHSGRASKNLAIVCVCGKPWIKGYKQRARGRIDGTGQRRPIYVVVKTYLQTPIVRYGKVAKPKTTHADMTWHDMPWHDMLT